MNQKVVVFLATFWCCNGIYLTNQSSKVLAHGNDDWPDDGGIWGPLLEKWALAADGNKRQSRVMAIPLNPNAYVLEDKVDDTQIPKESKVIPGKVVHNPNNNFNPSNNNNYNPSNNNYNYNRPQSSNKVSETDLYLLGAIEKMVYRVDFMEKRLRRVEEMLYYVMAGNRVDTEPCPENFTRAGPNCYYFASDAGREYDWKMASKRCKKMKAALAEMETIEENQDVIAHIQTTPSLKGKDFWTGGLNPGLLWIWSNSARPVSAPGSQDNKENPSAAIKGEGRCLRLAYDPQLRSYSYKGSDCSVRYSYICELPENTSSNEISRLGKNRKIFDEL